MSIWAQLSNTCRVLEDRFSNPAGTARTFTWMGQDIPCTVGGTRNGNTPVVGGFDDTSIVRLFVRRDAMPDQVTADQTDITVDSDEITVDSDFRFPEQGDVVVFELDEYRVGQVMVSPSHFIFPLEEPNS